MLLIHGRSSVYMRIDFAVDEKKYSSVKRNEEIRKISRMRSLTECYKNPCVAQPSVMPTLSVHWAAHAIEISSTNNSIDDNKTIFCQRERFDELLTWNWIQKKCLISNSQWSIGHHRAHRLHILHKWIHLQIGIIQIFGAIGITEQIEYTVDRFYCVASVGWKLDIPWIGCIRWRVHWMICKNQK